MHQHAAQRPPQLVDIGSERMPAAFAVRERHHAIDIRRQCVAFVAACNQVSAVCAAQLLAATTAM